MGELVRSFGLLGVRVRLETDDAELAARLDYLAQSSRQDFPVRRELGLDAVRRGRGFDLREDGERVERVPHADAAAERLYARAYAAALAELEDHFALHAGLGSWHGRRFLAVGPSGAGKTTLLVRSLLTGGQVEGDELVYVRGADATALPRRLRVKEPGLARVSELATEIRRMPCLVDAEGKRVWALDPTECGYGWHIRTGPVEAIFYLERSTAAGAEVVSCPRVEMARRVMSQCAPPRSGRRDWIGEIAALLDGARCYILRASTPEAAASAAEAALATWESAMGGE